MHLHSPLLAHDLMHSRDAILARKHHLERLLEYREQNWVYLDILCGDVVDVAGGSLEGNPAVAEFVSRSPLARLGQVHDELLSARRLDGGDIGVVLGLIDPVGRLYLL